MIYWQSLRGIELERIYGNKNLIPKFHKEPEYFHYATHNQIIKVVVFPDKTQINKWHAYLSERTPEILEDKVIASATFRSKEGAKSWVTTFFNKYTYTKKLES